MRNITIHRSASIDVSFTADQWGLFHEPGRDEVAIELNAALRDAVQTPGATARSVEEAMQIIQIKHDRMGADDSEPQGLIDHVIEKIFRDEDG